jgi:hypothetical protein
VDVLALNQEPTVIEYALRVRSANEEYPEFSRPDWAMRDVLLPPREAAVVDSSPSLCAQSQRSGR